MALVDPEKAYAADRGDHKLTEQKRRAAERWPCCWAPRSGKHAFGCRLQEEEEAEDVPNPDQGSLM